SLRRVFGSTRDFPARFAVLIIASMLFQTPAPVADLLRTQWFHNSVQAWLTAATTAVVAFIILMLIRRAALGRLGAIASRTTNHIDDMVVGVIGQTRAWVLLAMSIYLATLPLTLPRIGPYLHTAAKLVFLWQMALWGGAAVSFWVTHYMRHRTTSN